MTKEIKDSTKEERGEEKTNDGTEGVAMLHKMISEKRKELENQHDKKTKEGIDGTQEEISRRSKLLLFVAY